MQQKLISFHGDQQVKDAHIAQLQFHYNADEIIQGQYWEDGKGCDTGCSFHSDDHNQWAIQLGIPKIIGMLRDRIFEGLSNKEAKEFPLLVSKATPVGVDLTPVWKKFLIWVLIDPSDGVIKYAKNDQTKKAISDVADLIEKSLTQTVSEFEFQKVRSAAAPALYSPALFLLLLSACSPDAPAYDAVDAVDAAVDAAAYAAAYAGYAADKKSKYSKMRDQLVKLLTEAA